MKVDLPTIFEDPRLLFFGFDGEFARFAPMTRDSYAQSIFFDQRLKPASPQMIRVPLGPLIEHLHQHGFTPPRIGFIHHFAQSGSTLLARALDLPSNLVIREPLHLRQLGVEAGARGQPSDALRTRLDFSLTMLGKRFAPGAPLIVKGSVPVSLLAEPIAARDPGRPAILLYFPLDDYCAAVLRTSNHVGWLESVTAEIALGDDPLVGDIAALRPAEKAAALWFSMIKRFERLLAVHPAMCSLDANQLFDRPAETIAAASALFGAAVTPAAAEAIAAGPLFATYSKNPAMAYDRATRIERRDQTKAALGRELILARQWIEARAEPVPTMLERPLLGAATALL